MGIRTARSGGSAVRWAYGVLLTLCVALAVLVHHEISGAGESSMPSATHAVMPGPAQGAHMPLDDASPAAAAPSPHGLADSGCAMSAMQHCTTASVSSVQLAIPGQSTYNPSADLLQVLSGRTPGAVVSRAPPDLTVLSQLRI
ncbi:hypothetical protein [Streptomyces sp. CdTB01]|uniref:hypothetical protein n=1 Tax=Streptomyces sp. CdTB01 TaxID=1725411 RepID=UPI00073AC115|nr:hypothetical protein [Streptomyces sp. CdTB01]ALV33537.1 hypothetical protein AS200_16940 [Streptomyces sp. CdTB01]